MSGTIGPSSIPQGEYASGTARSTMGWFQMESPAKYREFAEECERLAKQTRDDRHRAVLLEMAQVWKQLAEADDRKGIGESARS